MASRDPEDHAAAEETVAVEEKRAAAEAAAGEVRDGMRVGLGTGTTVAHLLPALARRDLHITCVATSPDTEAEATRLGLRVVSFDAPHALDRLDIAIDGADQVDSGRWLVKGGHGAQTREKIVAAEADRFVVIVSSGKLVERIHSPVPMELMRFGLASTLRHVGAIGPWRRRDGQSPDGNLIVDYVGEIEVVSELAAALSGIPGVVEHGLFPPSMVHEVIAADPGGGIRRL
jgi:ribose 5-phosphate isomerase A